MAKPAARISDPTSCPMPGHGAKAVASGSSDVFFDGLAAARQGDTCTCGSALASAVSATVFINGKNAALVGTTGTHGDAVISGSGTVIIGDSHTPAPFIPPTPLNILSTWISFSIPASESYEGLACTAHFEDGSTLSGVFDADNVVKFANISGKVCQKIVFGTQDELEGASLFDNLFNATLK
ncbi:PAAR domain-containing protein [Pseudomonas cichorii]|uniref:PAAR domain-containing protein n=1 Tax=Pseudomonas cichorii TaxID=36746 RepID=UPI0018E6026E|nr:PAAR domain-containing protein [Pseudomonas cichorii]MBI6853690.1 PAAR domain-containing protein [Pseudomonas cichorii]